MRFLSEFVKRKEGKHEILKYNNLNKYFRTESFKVGEHFNNRVASGNDNSCFNSCMNSVN